jgi:hypothetical protein
MKKNIFFWTLLFLFALTGGAVFSQNVTSAEPVAAKPKVILLIAEQNIEGPQKAWWASEIDLSTTEAAIATKLIEEGYDVIDTSVAEKVIKQKPAFRVVDISQGESAQLGNSSGADYVILGKAIASSGGNVPQSNMKSCYGNITAKLIRAKDGKVIAYLDAAGNSAHPDLISGGREALSRAAESLALKIIDALNKQK